MSLFESHSPEETFELGRRLGRKAVKGQIYTLDGDLGAGKTVFAQGFAAGLGIEDHVSSPTFTILQVYDGGRLNLYHFDAYRIADPEEMEEIGFEEYLDGDGVCLIEWACLVEDLLPADIIRVVIDRDNDRGFDYRSIRVEGCALTEVEK